MAMTNEQLTKWIDEIFGTIDEIKQNSGDISGLTRSVRQLREDLTATQADVTDLEDQTAGVVSLPKAALQHFTDGSATQALDLVADIIPVQAGSGDPSPTNVRSISGYSSVTATASGKNLLDPSLIKQGGIVSDSGVMYDSDTRCYCDYKKVSPSAVYVASVENDKNILAVHFYSADNSTYWIRRETFSNLNIAAFTTPEDCSYIRMVYGYKTDAAIIPANITQAQLEIGEEATTYEAYQANTATISLGSTIYGGTVDFTTGALTIDKALVTYTGAEAENWSLIEVGDDKLYRIAESSRKSGTLASEVSAICNMFPVVLSSERTDNTLSGGATNFDIIKNDVASVEAWKTYLGTHNLQILYELATPTTTTLTPAQLQLLQGENNVSATSGPITLTYAPDNVLAEVYAYIQKRFDTLTASLAANRTTRKTTKTLTKKED